MTAASSINVNAREPKTCRGIHESLKKRPTVILSQVVWAVELAKTIMIMLIYTCGCEDHLQVMKRADLVRHRPILTQRSRFAVSIALEMTDVFGDVLKANP